MFVPDPYIMRKLLLKNLSLTVVLSFILSSVLFFVYYESADEGLEGKQALLILFAVADIIQHLLLFIFSLPVLFLASPTVYSSKVQRPLFYFGGATLVTLISLVSIVSDNPGDMPLLIPNVVFLAIYALFYFRLTKQQ